MYLTIFCWQHFSGGLGPDLPQVTKTQLFPSVISSSLSKRLPGSDNLSCDIPRFCFKVQGIRPDLYSGQSCKVLRSVGGRGVDEDDDGDSGDLLFELKAI